MSTFREAAVKILQKEPGPLSYIVITRKAMEQNILNTNGSTPNATMGARLYTDVKNKKSPFVHVGKGRFELKPNWRKTATEVSTERVYDEDDTKTTGGKSKYLGKFGECRVLSELLLREYDASLAIVDLGVDIIATKDNKLFKIQVKTSNKKKEGSRWVYSIGNKSSNINNSKDLFYVFVMRDMHEVNFIIMPSNKVKEYSSKTENKNEGHYSITITNVDGKHMIKKVSVARYFNKWNNLV